MYSATSKPWAIKATAGNKQVTLKWAAVTSATNYGVCYATATISDISNCLNYAGGTWLDATNTTLKISNLINGKKYYFRVLAENANNILRVSNNISAAPKPYPINDTGITTCSNDYQSNLPCPVGYPGQDAESGRDVTHNDDSDGHAGFDFTKISSTGTVLPYSATSWNCVKDNVTGLMWEVKTDDSRLRDKDNTYSWYNPNSSTNGGVTGYQNRGSCTGRISCDTDGYVKAVNTATVCGKNDWRMPTLKELDSIVDNSRFYPAIDTSYFPDTVSSWFWTSSPNAGSSANAWFVNFNYGLNDNRFKDYGYAVRLVRGGR